MKTLDYQKLYVQKTPFDINKNGKKKKNLLNIRCDAIGDSGDLHSKIQPVCGQHRWTHQQDSVKILRSCQSETADAGYQNKEEQQGEGKEEQGKETQDQHQVSSCWDTGRDEQDDGVQHSQKCQVCKITEFASLPIPSFAQDQNLAIDQESNIANLIYE